MRYLLDTDICIWMFRRREPVLSRVMAMSPDDFAIAATTEAELRFGALRSANAAAEARRVEAWLAVPVNVLPFERDAARAHADLRFALRQQPIGERDLCIASVALSRRLTVVTRNVREFARVPGLQVEEWSE